MAFKKEPVQIVEIDIDFCTRAYGQSPCTALLGTTGPYKCYNSWNTCQDKANYNKGVLTLRFVSPLSKVPTDSHYFPVLESVSTFSSSVNLYGGNPKLGGLGKRGKVTVTLTDFVYHDRYWDKYAIERRSGVAQVNEGGYTPESRGTFFSKFKARHPNYANRPLRVINSYLNPNGSLDLSNTETRHFVITEFEGPADTGKVVIEAKDILVLSESKSALAPKPSKGVLATDITDSATGLTLSPEGIGNAEYPSFGFATLGSEVVIFTRANDSVTLFLRGLYNTQAKSHSAGQTFQVAVSYQGETLNEVVEDLILNYTETPSGFLPAAKHQLEVEKWGPTIKINTLITRPTPVADLLGELSILGASIWWDDVNQEIGLKLNHPLEPFLEPTLFTDDNSIQGIFVKDKDEERITQIHFYSVQEDPTKSVTDKSNYERVLVTVDTDAESVNNFGEPRYREIFCRWLNTGNDALVNIISKRLLSRFSKSPTYYTITLDAKDISVNLADVIAVESRVITDDTGKKKNTRLEVTEKRETRTGHNFTIVAQSHDYTGKYGYIMPDDANPYGSSTAQEKNTGAYIVGPSLVFPDGEQPYRII